MWLFQKATNAELLAKVVEVTTIPSNQQMSATDLLLNSSTMDFMDLDFNSDTLFNTLNQPFAFPNPKEFCELMLSLHYLHEPFGLCSIIKKKKTQKFIFCDGIVWYIQSINIFLLQPTVQNTVREICNFVRLLKYVLTYLGLLWNRDVDLLLQMECQLPTWCSQAWFLYSQI